MAAFEPWQRSLLAELPVARLATIAPGGRPRLVPVCYVLLDDDTLAIAVDEKPKRSARLARLRDIEADPRVTLLADRYDDDWSRLAWVRVDGEARVVEPGGDQPKALALLRERYPQYSDMALESLPLIIIEPVRVTGWRYTTPEHQTEG